MTRRKLLFSASAGVLGVTVLNTVTGCSSGDGPEDNPPGDAPLVPEPSAAPLTWKRVDLSFVSAYLLIRGSEVAIVDLGVAGSETAIEAGLKAAGSGWANVKHVILTHKHADHAGSLPGVQPKVQASWYAGEADVAAIKSPTALKPVKDGDDVFGLQIIGTPGHTPGHVAVFDAGNGVLVTGDALRNTAGLLAPDPKFTEDPKVAAESVKKLATLDVRTILPGHGAPLEAGASDALEKLAASL